MSLFWALTEGLQIFSRSTQEVVRMEARISLLFLRGGGQSAICGIGFINQANDSKAQKTRIRSKFKEDLKSARLSMPDLSVFVFFTNLNFSISEKAELAGEALEGNIRYCEIFDRERIRIALDSPDGFAARVQYLNVPLSEAEQASFFAKWGADIQSMISNNFSEVRKTLDQMLFIQECNRVLQTLYVIYELDREYSAEDIGHFRAFMALRLKEPKSGIFAIKFGSFDCIGRASATTQEVPERMQPGIGNGFGIVKCEMHVDDDLSQLTDKEHLLDYVEVGRGEWIGSNFTNKITLQYDHDNWLFRFGPKLRLGDLDEAMFMPLANESLAAKISKLMLFANGYKLFELRRSEMWISADRDQFECSVKFSPEELEDKWVKIRRLQGGSAHWLRFQDEIPLRLLSSKFIGSN